MTIKELEGLNILLRHAESDMLYGEGGSYNDGNDNFDEKDAEKARLGMRFILRLIQRKNHSISANRINKALSSGKLSIEI